MELVLERIKSDSDTTIGILRRVDDVAHHFKGFTCEDEYQEIKVPKETRIPQGRYQIKLRENSGMARRYKKIYPWHRGMLWLQDVPRFEYIYIHHGNTDDHTEGCILVGWGANLNPFSEYSINQSRPCYAALAQEIYRVFDAGEECWITVIDSDL